MSDNEQKRPIVAVFVGEGHADEGALGENAFVEFMGGEGSGRVVWGLLVVVTEVATEGLLQEWTIGPCCFLCRLLGCLFGHNEPSK